MSDKMKYVYFDIRGRGEYVRLVLEAAGKPYDDVRVSFDDWPGTVKAQCPAGQLPYLEYQGKKYTQSNAIAAFIAKQNGLYGKTNLDELRIGEVMGLWEDQFKPFVTYRWAKDETVKADTHKKLLEVDLPKYFGLLESFLKDNGSSGYIVGNSMSLADLYVFDQQDNLLQLKKDALQDYPLLQKLRQNVQNHPKLKSYLAKRKETPF